MSRMFLLLTAALLAIVTLADPASAQYRRYSFPGLGGGGRYFVPRPLPQPMIRTYRIPGLTAGTSPYYRRGGVQCIYGNPCRFY